MQIPQSRTDKLKVRDISPIPLTEEGFRRLKEKLARLKASIADLAGEARRAADYGDRSENVEYQVAKSNLRRAHRQILIIEDQIKRAAIIKMGASRSGKIQLGSTVVLEVGGSRKTFQIVGPSETDPARGRISHLSPLGAALLGHKVEDKIALQIGGGSQIYNIVEVR